ncbi:hypothetical protein ACGF7W_12975 [Streptomyces sp. NPDC048219]|uniref:hypothetical protein n=1 Tax=unclassified Streptomyces TaxID=2593676 RepID=UPI0034127535
MDNPVPVTDPRPGHLPSDAEAVPAVRSTTARRPEDSGRAGTWYAWPVYVVTAPL